MIKTTAGLVLLILLLSSCLSEAPATPYPASGLPVVNCLLSNSTHQTLRLTRSKADLNSKFFEEISEASISLYEQDSLVGIFEKSGYGEWKIEFTPKTAKTYRLVVEIEGEKTIQAYTTMPIPNSITAERGKEDRRMTKFFSQSSQQLSSVYWMFVMRSSLKDYIYDLNNPTLDEDPHKELFQEFGTDHPNADRFNQVALLPDLHDEKISTIGYRYYARILPKQEKEKNYRFSVQAYASVEAHFIVFRDVSEEYDRYLKSVVEKRTYYKGENDPARWFDENYIYNNIENGLGIFGAYIEKSFYFNNNVTTTTIQLN